MWRSSVNLDGVDLSGNPLTEEMNYRLITIRLLSNLEILDNHGT